MKNNNNLFEEKNIFTPELYVKGIYIAAQTETDVFVKRENAEQCAKASAIIPLRRGSIYVIRFDSKPDALRVGVCTSDPRALKDGEGMSGVKKPNTPYYEGETPDYCDFMYVPQTEGEYLVVYTGENMPEFFIGDNPILIGRDTDDLWWYAPRQKDLFGNADSWGNWAWTSDEVLEHIYEPMRAKHPDYITRQWIGKDETGKYDMWSYIFEPEDYEQVLFITGGIHAAEMDGYLGLARFFEYMVDSDGSHAGLHYLRTKVKIVLIPIVNVGSASENHLRENLVGADLNRDFEARSQAETLNTIWLFRQYEKQLAAAIDFHTSKATTLDLYYQFQIQSNAAPCWLKTINHIYEYLKDKGLTNEPTDLSYIPGKYDKSDAYLQGYFYNHFGVPTLVAEHHHLRWYPMHSAENMQLAVDFYGNFIIQTALAKLKLIK